MLLANVAAHLATVRIGFDLLSRKWVTFLHWALILSVILLASTTSRLALHLEQPQTSRLNLSHERESGRSGMMLIAGAIKGNALSRYLQLFEFAQLIAAIIPVRVDQHCDLCDGRFSEGVNHKGKTHDCLDMQRLQLLILYVVQVMPLPT